MQDLVTLVETQLSTLSENIEGPIGIAVSGGGDSLALLYLASDWAKMAGRTLFGLTVDHGLRPEAKAEARRVGEHCAQLGLSHRTLEWSPPTGTAGQARFRRARHQLLAQATRHTDAALLLMGHTLDDQYETLAMRAARLAPGETATGIRALAISPVWPEGRGVFIGRPLLGTRRADLRQILRGQGIEWVEDPSNQDLGYERVRVRQTLRAADLPSLQIQLETSEVARQTQDSLLSAWIAEHVFTDPDGLVRLEITDLPPTPVLAEGLAWALMIAAGTDKRAELAGRMALAADIMAAPRQFQARTLGGAWIAPRQGEIHIARDPGGVAVVPDEPHPNLVWDGRFHFTEDKTPENNGKLALNLHSDPDMTLVAPMARATYPAFDASRLAISALNETRLKDIAFMWNYNKLMIGRRNLV